MRMSLPRGRAARLGAVAAVAACVLVAAGTGPASASALARPGWRLVSYRGYQFEVPGSWPVIQLAADPHQCVRFDRHAVYLGRPGPNEDCPARGAGRNTEALLVQPAAGPGAARSAQNLVADLITVTAPRISVTRDLWRPPGAGAVDPGERVAARPRGAGRDAHRGLPGGCAFPRGRRAAVREPHRPRPTPVRGSTRAPRPVPPPWPRGSALLPTRPSASTSAGPSARAPSQT
jgi:hypothetical protein